MEIIPRVTEMEGDSRVAKKGESIYRDPAFITGFTKRENMRDLLFKNLTSDDKRKRVICSSEIVDKQGVRTVVRRHFIYFVKEVEKNMIEKQAPYLFVLKERNTKQKKEKFYCRMKGTVYAVCKDKLFLIHFMHSLKICLNAIPDELVKYSPEENIF